MVLLTTVVVMGSAAGAWDAHPWFQPHPQADAACPAGEQQHGISLQVRLHPSVYCTLILNLGGDLFERGYSKAAPMCGGPGMMTHGFGLGGSERPIGYFVYTEGRLQ